MLESIINFFKNLFGGSSSNETSTEDISTRGLPEPEGFPEDGQDIFDGSIGDKVEVSTRNIEPEVSTRGLGDPSATPLDPVGDVIFGEEFGDAVDPSGTPVTVTSPKFLWCLDNGHGELQQGKRSPLFPDGTRFEEWEFNRDIVKRIMEKLDQMGIQSFNIVPETQVGSFLKGRVARANAKVSDLGLPKIYVSIHANAAPLLEPGKFRDGVGGIETFAHPNSNKGKLLAGVFQRHLIQTLGWKDRGVKQSGFYVLQHTSMPAVLTENGFYTDTQQTRDLLNDEVRQKIADAHVRAIFEIEQNGIVGTVV